MTKGTKALREIIAAMQEQQSIDEQLVLVESLLDISGTILERSTSDAGSMHIIATHLGEMRQLLSDLGRNPVPGSAPETARGLAERCFDLEGWVKELRNDREWLEKAHAVSAHQEDAR